MAPYLYHKARHHKIYKIAKYNQKIRNLSQYGIPKNRIRPNYHFMLPFFYKAIIPPHIPPKSLQLFLDLSSRNQHRRHLPFPQRYLPLLINQTKTNSSTVFRYSHNMFATNLLFFEMPVYTLLPIFAANTLPQLTMKYSLLAFIFFVLASVFASAGYALDNYYFAIIGKSKGLSQTDVKAIIQDSNGFMWFGTRNKLNRYDGKSFTVFNCYDPVAKKQNNNVSSLFEDKEQHLWVGTDKGVFILNPQTGVFSYMDTKTAEGMTMTDWIADIKEDRNGNIWIVVPNQGLFRYIYRSGILRFYAFGESNIPDHGSPQSICIDQSNRIWIGTNGKGVYLYNETTDQFTQYLGDAQGNTLADENIYTMADDGEYLILGIHEGKLRKMNKRKNVVVDMDAPEVHYKIIRCIAKLGDRLWIGTQAGIYIIDEDNETVHIHNDPMCGYSLSDNQVGKIYQDREGGIWVGTNAGGINYLSSSVLNFTRYIPLSQKETISSKRIREITEDDDQNIWVGTDDAGVNIFSPTEKTFKKLGRDIGDKLTSEQSLCLLNVDGNIWVGLFKNGLDIISSKDYKVKHYSGQQLGLNESSIYALCEDRHGNIWLGNGWGVYKGDRKTLQFANMPEFGLCYIYDIIEDSHGNMWIATMGNGVFKYNLESQKAEHYLHDLDNEHSISSNSVSSITEISNGDIWFATDRGGICKYNPRENNFQRISLPEGLPDDSAYKIAEDKNGNLWFGTNNGLIQMNPQDFSFHVYSTDNGLPSNQFNYGSAFTSSSGELFLGTSEGLISFFPDKINKNNFVPPVYITYIRPNNEKSSGKPESEERIKNFPEASRVVLQHDRNNIELGFVALSYASPTANQYAYKMENLDKEWIYTKDNQSATYANLSPGEYRFIVKACNNDNVWNEEGASIAITILPPWWRTWIAYVGYIIATTLCLLGINRYYVFRTKKKNQEKLRLFESEKERELYSSKIDFFTNVAHEIRTPLTLINGPLETLVEMDIEEPVIRKNIEQMQRNVMELLTLINQILDFRKIDANKITMNFTNCDIAAIINDVYQEFLPMALSHNKKFLLTLPKDKVYTRVDRESFIKILNNLFSNAVRYSDTHIEVDLEVREKEFCLTVSNDGEIVPADMVDKIFDPFYQLKKNANINASSGIGLSLARSLTELHHGTLIYQCLDDLNVFILTVPLNEVTVQEEESIEMFNDNSTELQSKQEKILVVEDNIELLSFMTDKLSQSFAVEKATNGAEAWDIILSKNISLVITDIMMPIMDGFELCKKIKSDIEYCHIPIILLTAKNDLNSKIKGLETGADVYIEKPFSFKYLITQLNSLLENRKREREAFMKKPYVTSQSIGLCKADEELINKIIAIIQDNITDSNFGVERLSEITNMSRSSLHRKIKALSGIPPTDFIRLIRLKKASELIAEGRYRTGEVCYIVGINSPSYFIKLFQKQFGMTPKDFEKQQKMSTNNDFKI